MKIATITKEPFILFMGANGHKTFGIEVQSVNSEEVCRRSGHSYRWRINDCTILRSTKEKFMLALGLNENEYEAIIKKIKDLWKENNYPLDPLIEKNF